MNLKKTVAIASAAGALCALAIPALAETTLYGSARVMSFYDTQKSGDNAITAGGVASGHGKSSTDFDLRDSAVSRFGVTTVVGKLSGKAEIGMGGNSSTTGTGNVFDVNQSGTAVGTGGNQIVYMRELYGAYKFEMGTLLVGQTFAPWTVSSAQVSNDDNGNTNDGMGGLYEGRQPHIKFTLNNGLYFLAMRPNGISGVNTGKAIYIPKLSVGYDGKTGNFSYGGGVLGQIIKNTSGTASAKSVNSIMGYAHAKAVVGPFDGLINIGAGQNLGDMAIKEGVGGAGLVVIGAAGAVGGAANPPIAGENISGASVGLTQIENALTYSILVAGGFTVSPMFKINTGVGYVNTQQGKHYTAGTDTGILWARHDDRYTAYVNTVVTLAKGVTITPEFCIKDQLMAANGAREQKDYLYGAKWQFDF